jgi:hypothetical protein
MPSSLHHSLISFVEPKQNMSAVGGRDVSQIDGKETTVNESRLPLSVRDPFLLIVVDVPCQVVEVGPDGEIIRRGSTKPFSEVTSAGSRSSTELILKWQVDYSGRCGPPEYPQQQHRTPRSSQRPGAAGSSIQDHGRYRHNHCPPLRSSRLYVGLSTASIHQQLPGASRVGGV